ncbi:riboflavin synthase [Candidatus Omnitrophota bacterium]
MFTGLIEETGTIASIARHGTIVDFTIKATVVTDDIAIGDSVAVNGACLTVTAAGASEFTVQAVEETIRRTTLGGLKSGGSVNLERSLRVGDRLGGHIVQGHVDCTGRIVSVRKSGENMILTLAVAPENARYIVEKGSVAIDGISLTVTTVTNSEFGVSVIPHSLNATTLRNARVGDSVNIETDIIGKYVEKLLHTQKGLTTERLEELGY